MKKLLFLIAVLLLIGGISYTIVNKGDLFNQKGDLVTGEVPEDSDVEDLDPEDFSDESLDEVTEEVNYDGEGLDKELKNIDSELDQLNTSEFNLDDL
ncbi:hypothetical protein A2716_00660 [candidate division WWE3 bacterium RIFCSPHIGHO2_01_FULL_40_23]|uniref:Uncharacterized protein n=1 Tax=candidate division WWE3 bacterium RIFCSPLOWO2_01_FULL_41_18 TaxID=1802625 RepID=A0A1F4VED7_UNCKA|nr:MAG: hypothetical protein A2716_00660 [candidate division WWE3 bacterium RIFCSPHIGHO2_01_FULL_40_23]OGC55505.1 MAG: hypothetical protein A3A78_00930 [candidate division WWE3 bacterium RIFCSPLOWO2_01_FULL_41_18]